jgi:hypothetical protein
MVKYSMAKLMKILVKVAVKNNVEQMKINLSSGKNLSQSQPKMVKNFKIFAKILELFQFNY